MRSKIEIELKANGTLLDITQGEDKIFQGAVGVTEYHLSVASGITGDYNWRPTDIVYMSLKRNDGQTAQVKMTAENGGWVWTSNGWETDVDISGTGNLELSFIGKRYSTVSVGTVAFEKTTEKIDLIVYESAGYVPQNIDLEVAEELQEAINVLQLDKVGRYSVSEENLPYLPAEIVYDLDGAKTPNNVYFDFTNNVVDYDGKTREKVGVILVISNDGVQTELFLTSDGKMYSRTIDGGVTDFVSTAKVDFEFYTYKKVEIDQKDADTLQSAKDYADDNFYNETDADNRFVHLTGSEIVDGAKTFTASPIIPDPTANTHAVNRESMQAYAYSKTETNNITQGMTVDTYAHFLEWIAGTYTDVIPAGTTPADFLIGKKVYITEPNQSNYRCINTPITSISDFEVLAEDIKALQEITANTFDDITATNGQSCVEQINDKVNLKSQITEEADLTILTTDWVDNTTNYYYDYFNANFTNPTKQRFEFISNDLTQNTTLANEQFVTLKLENITSGSDYGIRIYVNIVPSIDITLKVMLETYTDKVFNAGDISASNVTYDNTTSGLIATNVKTAIDELESKKVDKVLDSSDVITNESPADYVYANSNNVPKKFIVETKGSIYSGSPYNLELARFDEFGNIGSNENPTHDYHYTRKDYVDKFTLYKHKIYLLNVQPGNYSNFISFELILTNNTAVTSLNDIKNILFDKYTPNWVPAAGSYYSLTYSRTWLNVTGIRYLTTSPTSLELLGIGYLGANPDGNTELKISNLTITLSDTSWTVVDTVETLKGV